VRAWRSGLFAIDAPQVAVPPSLSRSVTDPSAASSNAINQESIMQKLDSTQWDLVHGGSSSSPTPTPPLPSRPAPIFKPLYPVEP
jgi:hypothetical protein